MASRRLSLSTHKAPSPPRYLPLLVDDYLAKAGSSSSAEKEAGNGGKERDLERDASTLDDRLPRRWPPSSTGLLSNASSHLSSWRATNDLFYQHHLPRRILVILTFAFGLGCIVILGAALDVPVVGFARHSWGLFSDERWMDREETYRWRGVSPGLTPSEETPFLLARFGYPSHPRPIDDEPLPSLLHVVPPGKDVFSYLQWLSIASGVHRISPRRTLAHMIQGTVPSPGENFWWDEVVRLPGFEVLEIPDFDEVFGNPVHDISHKADVIRMRALREHGGVYIDTDVLVLRDFKELMTGREEMVLGVEQAHGSMVRPVEVEGLCNAVIVAKKGASFLERWWQTYRQFNGGKSFDSGRESWNYHSVQLPWQLAKNASEAKTPITILDHEAFFSPLWDEPGLRWVHGTIRDPRAPKPVTTTSTTSSSTPSPSPKGPKPPSSRFRFALADIESPLSSDFDQEDTPSPADPLPDLETTLHGELAPQVGGWSFSTTGQYAYHMWHHLLSQSISSITDGAIKSERFFGPEDALARDSSFNRVARRYLDEEMLGRWRVWEEERRKKEKARESRFKGMRKFRDWSGVLKERGDAHNSSSTVVEEEAAEAVESTSSQEA